MGRASEPTKNYNPLPFEDDITPDMMTKEEEE